MVVFIKTILTLDSQRGEQRQVGYPSSRFQQGREVIVKEKHSICVTPSFRRFFPSNAITVLPQGVFEKLSKLEILCVYDRKKKTLKTLERDSKKAENVFVKGFQDIAF